MRGVGYGFFKKGSEQRMLGEILFVNLGLNENTHGLVRGFFSKGDNRGFFPRKQKFTAISTVEVVKVNSRRDPKDLRARMRCKGSATSHALGS